MKYSAMIRLISALVLAVMLVSLSACSFPFSDEEEIEEDPPSGGPDTEEEEKVNFENRFDVLNGTLDDNAIAQLKRLYSYYDDSVYEWLANLWDDEIGGFYYANSSRDYEGFLPDIESTRQTLAIIRTSGMVDKYGANVDEAFASVFPKEFADKIVNFVRECQSEEDGYFYHEQWGTTVGTSRKGRDLDQAITLLKLFGAEPYYPTALDRLSGVSPTASLGRSAKDAVSSFVSATDASTPYYLQSKEGLIKYLDTFDFRSNSHDTGHVVGSLTSQLKAAGLLDCALDYFDALQEEIYNEQVAAGETPTGLWQDVVNYTSLSGLYKIGGMYDEAGRSMNYLNECVRSAIECIKQDANCDVIIYVYNPWAGLSKAVNAMKRAIKNGDTRYNLEETYALIRSELGELVSATVDKLDIFAKDSGGFSYNQLNSAPRTQGVIVSMGLSEGDVNATNIAVNSISGMIFSSIGLERVDIWNAEDFDRFLEMMGGVDPVEKLPIPSNVMTFDEYDEGDIPLTVTAAPPSGVMYDPTDDSNMAMYFHSPAGSGTKSYINFNAMDSFSCAILEFDVMMSGGSNATTHQIKMHGPFGNMYMLLFKYNSTSKTLTVTDCSHHTGGVEGNLSIVLPAEEWSKLRFEIYTSTEHELAKNGFVVKIFVNDEFAAYSTNYFGPTKTNANVAPTIGFSDIEIYGMQAAESHLWLDNISFELLAAEDFVEE